MEYIDSGIRRRVEIDGENYYIVVTHNSVTITTPFENRPENITRRLVIDRLADEITATMEYQSYVDAAEEVWDEDD
jgi:hypothetical protein